MRRIAVNAKYSIVEAALSCAQSNLSDQIRNLLATTTKKNDAVFFDFSHKKSGPASKKPFTSIDGDGALVA